MSWAYWCSAACQVGWVVDNRAAIGEIMVVFVGAGWGVGAGLGKAVDLSRVDRAIANSPWTVSVIACTASQKC